MKRRLLSFTVLMLLLSIVLAACGTKDETTATATEKPIASEVEETPTATTASDELPPAEKTKLIMRLNWKIKGEFVPFLVAKETGIFKKYGLDVEVLEGAGSVKTMQSIAQKSDDFGVTSSVEPMQGIEQGMKVKMIASYMSRSPLVVLSYPDNPIKTIKDMEGKSVATSADSVFAAIFEQLVTSNGADYSKAKLVKVDDAAKSTLFMSKKVDGIEAFATNEYPFFEDKLGIKLQTLYTGEFGFDIAGLMVIANDEFLAENPNTTRRFLAAVSEAYQYSFAHPEEAAAIAKKLFPDTVDEALIAKQIKVTSELAVMTDVPYGTIDEKNMEETATKLLATGLIKSKLPLTDYFTNEYVAKQ